MSGKSKKPQKKRKAGEYERIGRTLESVFATGYSKKGRIYWINFSRGVVFGIGAAVGGTIVVTILLWLLSFADQAPLIGDFIDSIRNSLENGQ